MKPKFLDLFAGAGGLSEGFIQSGYEPIAHVEMDTGACFTLKTRLAYHWLKNQGKQELYFSYLSGKITRDELYSHIPKNVINSVLNEEISEESLPRIFQTVDSYLTGEKLDLIIGGPPCQAYSVVGRSRDKNKMKGDKRNYLYIHYVQFLKKYKPRYFVFENVLGLLSAKDQDGLLYFDKMKTLFKEHGYLTEFSILNSSEYGVPQARKRIILVGKLKGEKGFYPYPEKSKELISASEVLHDLPKLNAGQGTHLNQTLEPTSIDSYLYRSGIRSTHINKATWHIARPNIDRDLNIYKIAVDMWNKESKRLNYNDLPEDLKTHNNRKSFIDRFKVVSNDHPCHTVVAHIAKDGHHYIHPDKIQNRSLSVREAARIQTFPDDFYFEGSLKYPSRTAAFKQIGNAVPVVLAKKIATTLKEHIIKDLGG